MGRLIKRLESLLDMSIEELLERITFKEPLAKKRGMCYRKEFRTFFFNNHHREEGI